MTEIRLSVRHLYELLCNHHPNEAYDGRIITYKLDETRIPHFHGMPKIHKIPMGCRPIVSNINAPTEGLSKWLTAKLRKYVRYCSSFIKDSQAAQAQITALSANDTDTIYTMDIESMYTNIPVFAAINAVQWFLDTRNDPLTTIILNALRIIMENTYFVFADGYWKQTQGLAMGTPVAPIVATLYVGYYEETKIIPRFVDHIRYFARYLDDIFLIWDARQDPYSFNKFRATLRQIPGLSWTFEQHYKEATFLDLCVYRNGNHYYTRTHQKELNLYLYPVYNSAQPPGVRTGLIKGLLLKYKMQNSEHHEFCKMVNLLFHRLLARGFQGNLLKPLFMKALKDPTPITKTASRTIFYKIPFDPNGITKDLLRHQFGISNLSLLLEKMNCGRLIICYKRPKNIGELITKTRFTTPPSDETRSLQEDGALTLTQP
jgi:hypothetical protein